MAFAVTRAQSAGSKLWLVREPDGELVWDPRKREATRFDEANADAIAADINRYSSVEVMVEGCQ